MGRCSAPRCSPHPVAAQLPVVHPTTYLRDAVLEPRDDKLGLRWAGAGEPTKGVREPVVHGNDPDVEPALHLEGRRCPLGRHDEDLAENERAKE